MSPERLNRISNDIYNFVFESLDNEPDIDGNKAGRIATIVQKAFENAMGETSEDDDDCCQECGAMLQSYEIVMCEYCVESFYPQEYDNPER